MRLLAALAPRSPRARCGLSRRLDRLHWLWRLDRFPRFHGVALGGLTVRRLLAHVVDLDDPGCEFGIDGEDVSRHRARVELSPGALTTSDGIPATS